MRRPCTDKLRCSCPNTSRREKRGKKTPSLAGSIVFSFTAVAMAAPLLRFPASLRGRQRLKASSVNGGGGCCRGVHLPFLSLASHGRQAHTTTQSPISNDYHIQSCRFHFSVFHSSTAKPFTFQPSCKSPSPQITVFRCHFNV